MFPLFLPSLFLGTPFLQLSCLHSSYNGHFSFPVFITPKKGCSPSALSLDRDVSPLPCLHYPTEVSESFSCLQYTRKWMFHSCQHCSKWEIFRYSLFYVCSLQRRSYFSPSCVHCSHQSLLSHFPVFTILREVCLIFKLALSTERAVLSHCSYDGKFSFFSIYADSRKGCFLPPCLHCTDTTPRQGCFSFSHLYCSQKKLLPPQVFAVPGSSVMFLDRAVSTFHVHTPPRKSCFPAFLSPLFLKSPVLLFMCALPTEKYIFSHSHPYCP